MRLGEKVKRGLRIGLKIGGVGLAVAGGTRMAKKSGDPNQPLVGSYSPETTPSPPSAGLPSLVGKTSELRTGASDFASLAGQLAEQQKSKSKFGFF